MFYHKWSCGHDHKLFSKLIHLLAYLVMGTHQRFVKELIHLWLYMAKTPYMVIVRCHILVNDVLHMLPYMVIITFVKNNVATIQPNWRERLTLYRTTVRLTCGCSWQVRHCVDVHRCRSWGRWCDCCQTQSWTRHWVGRQSTTQSSSSVDTND